MKNDTLEHHPEEKLSSFFIENHPSSIT